MLGHGGRERQEEKIRPKTGGDSKALAGGRHVDRDRTFQVKPHAYRYHGDRGELLEKGVHLHSTKDRYSFDDTINSKVLCFAFGLVAEIERNLISARTKEALAARREQGVILGRRKGSYTKLQRLINAGEEIAGLLNDGRSIAMICERCKVARNTFDRFRAIFLQFTVREGKRNYSFDPENRTNA